MRKCIFYSEAGCKTQRRPQVSGRPFLHRSTARDRRETTRVSAVSSSWHCNKHKRNTVCFSNIQSTPQLWAELQIFKWIPSEMKDYTTGVQRNAGVILPLCTPAQPSHPPDRRLHFVKQQLRRLQKQDYDSLKAMLTLWRSYFVLLLQTTTKDETLILPN